MKNRKRANTPKTPFAKPVRMQFLAILRDAWSEDYAIRKLRLQRSGYYHYKRETPEWVARVNEAKEIGVLALEDEANRRGKNGVLEPVVSGGKIVTHRRVYSDRLLSMTLKAKSKTYAPVQSTGANFEHALAGAAEKLLGRLTALIEHAEAADAALLQAARAGGST